MQARQSGRRRDLDDRRVAADRERGGDGLADRPGDPPADPGEPGGDSGVDRAVTAVGHRQAAHVQAGDRLPQAARHGPGDPRGRQRALELVRGDQDVTGHGSGSNSRIAAMDEPLAVLPSRSIMTSTSTGRLVRSASLRAHSSDSRMRSGSVTLVPEQP